MKIFQSFFVIQFTPSSRRFTIQTFVLCYSIFTFIISSMLTTMNEHWFSKLPEGQSFEIRFNDFHQYAILYSPMRIFNKKFEHDNKLYIFFFILIKLLHNLHQKQKTLTESVSWSNILTNKLFQQHIHLSFLYQWVIDFERKKKCFKSNDHSDFFLSYNKVKDKLNFLNENDLIDDWNFNIDTQLMSKCC